MKSTVTRSFTLTACTGQRFNRENSEYEDYSAVLVGKYTVEKATRSLRRKTGDETILITFVEYDTDTYTMPASDFIAHATKED